MAFTQEEEGLLRALLPTAKATSEIAQMQKKLLYVSGEFAAARDADTLIIDQMRSATAAKFEPDLAAIQAEIDRLTDSIEAAK